MKATPITQTAKSTPFKISDSLVRGAADLGASKNRVITGNKEEKEEETSPGNNQQPANPGSSEFTDQGSKGKAPLTDGVAKEKLGKFDVDLSLDTFLKNNPFTS